MLDPLSFKVWPISVPRPYHPDRKFLLQFIERLLERCAIKAFDFSAYSRVVVERVEKYTPTERWMAGCREINDFERLVTDDGTRLVKIFFHISKDEQLERFADRLKNLIRRWKLTHDDFRIREKWDEYSAAINCRFSRTFT